MSTAPESTLDLRGRSITVFVAHEIAARLETMEVGESLEVVVDDSEALSRDLDAWSAATGHAVQRGAATAGHREYSVRKGVPAEVDRGLAMVISEPGLFELLSPLGFALAAGLEGIAVRIYFQGPAVRVLKRGFTPRMRGAGRPFSRFAFKGLERVGHLHPHDKLRQLRQRGGEFYVCGPSMEHYKVAKDELIFPDVKIAAYLTFMSVMADSDIQIFV